MASHHNYPHYYPTSQSHPSSEVPQTSATYASEPPIAQLRTQSYNNQTYHQPQTYPARSANPQVYPSYQPQSEHWHKDNDEQQDSSNRAAEALRNLRNSSYTGATSKMGSLPPPATTASGSNGAHLQPQAGYQHSWATNHSQSIPSMSQHNPRISHMNDPRATQRQYTPPQRQLPESITWQQQYAPQVPARIRSPAQYAQLSKAQNVTDSSSALSQNQNLEQPSTAQHGYHWVQPHQPGGPETKSSDVQPHTRSQNNYDHAIVATVDPTQVYDPWEDIRRKKEAAELAQRKQEEEAAKDAARKEEAIRAAAKEAARKEEAAMLASRKEETTTSATRNQEQRQPLSAERIEKLTPAQPSDSDLGQALVSPPMDSADSAMPLPTGNGTSDEAKLRVLMAQMRQMNAINPALVARVWEEERKAYQASASKVKPTSSLPPQTSAPSVMQPKPVEKQRPATYNSSEPSATGGPVPSSTTPAPKSGTTVWPSEERKLLGASATKYLNGISDNAGKPITPKEFCDLLDGNPSYTELCEALEARGLKFDRSAFARAILAAVPSLNASKQSGQGPAPIIAASQRQSPGVVSGASNAPKKPAIQASAHQHLLQGNSIPPVVKIDVNLATTEEASAKSTIHDSVNPTTITKMSPQPDPNLLKPRSSEENGSNTQGVRKTKEEAARKRNFSELIDLSLLSDEENTPPLAKKKRGESQQAFEGQITFSTAQPGNFGPSNPHTISSNATNAGMETHGAHSLPANTSSLVMPIDRKKAARTSEYSSKTIAQDVLLAVGKHPVMRPLNAHLAALKKNLKGVNNSSDLSTLRWDLIDPGEPPSYMLSGRYTDGVDADDEGSEDEGRNVERRQDRPVPRTEEPQTNMPVSLPLHNHKKSRGRPPRHSFPGLDSSPIPIGDEGAKRKPIDLLVKNMSNPNTTLPRESAHPEVAFFEPPSAGQSGYSAFRQFSADGTPIKKRGRPVGWRKAIHGSEATKAQVPRVSSVKGANNAFHSPSAAIPKRNADADENPTYYYIYECKWENCRAQLHNLDTLRKHINKRHKQQAAGKLQCLWVNCESGRGRQQTPHHRLEFDSESAWRTHLELAHLGPIAWTLGDGPASGPSDAHDSASDAYLSDSLGRLVTPLITAPEHHTGISTPGSQPIRRGPGRPPKQKVTIEEEAKAAQRMLERKKKQIGPGMDRGGATLATEKRRMGLIDDEDFEEVIDEE